MNVGSDKSHKIIEWFIASFAFISTKACVAATGLVLTILLPLTLPLESVGKIYLAISIVSSITVFQRFGMDYLSLNRGLQAEAQDDNISSIFLNSLYAIIIVNIIIGTPIYYLVYRYFVNSDTYNYIADFIPFMIIWSLGLSVSYTLFQMYKIIGKPIMATMTRAFFQNIISVLLFSIALIIEYKLNLHTVIAIFSTVTVGVAFANSIHFLSIARGSFSVNLNLFHVFRQLRDSFIYFLYSTALFISSELDIWLMAYFFGPTEVALYATAKRLMILIAIFTDFSNVILPKKLAVLLQKDDIKNSQHLIRRLALIFTLLSSGIILIYALAGPYILTLVYGPGMAAVYNLLLTLLIAQTTILIIGSAETVLLIKSDTDARLILVLCAVLSASIQLIFTILFIPSLGMAAVPLGVLINILIYRFSLMITVKWRYQILTFMGW